MEIKVKRSRLAGVPAWALSVLTFVATIVYVMICKHYSMERELAGQSSIYIGSVKLVEITDFIVFFVLIPMVCFSICRLHPKSVWYTPFICNAVGFGMVCIVIIGTIVYLDYGTTLSFMIIWGGSCVLSVTGAISGAKTGRRRVNQSE